jgi:hypothetical protein
MSLGRYSPRRTMMNTDAFFIPDPHTHGKKIPLFKPIVAVHLEQTEHGDVKLGLLSRLSSGTIVERCGEGFDDRTVKVRANGQCYFVFLQDLEAQATAAFN